jgi:hypothetical protein
MRKHFHLRRAGYGIVRFGRCASPVQGRMRVFGRAMPGHDMRGWWFKDFNVMIST